MKSNISNYTEENLTHIAFPIGGIGAGMFCVEGTGALGKFSIRNKPNVWAEPNIFSSICIKKKSGETISKIIEGQVPSYKIFGTGGETFAGGGNGLHGKTYGLPRFKNCEFESNFPFATLKFTDNKIPLDVYLTAYSPFTPLDADNSSLPVGSLTYTFTNNTNEDVESIYYFSSFNFMNTTAHSGIEMFKDSACVYNKNNGFILNQPIANNDYDKGDFYVSIDDKDANVNTDWFNGGWYDVLTMHWNDINSGTIINNHEKNNKSPGGSIAVPFSLKPNEKKEITVKFAWYVPNTDLRTGEEEASCCGSNCSCNSKETPKETYRPWYCSKFANVEEVMEYFTSTYKKLYTISEKFSESIYKTTIPNQAIDAITSNLSILKSPTILRQTDGRIWAWEGCCDCSGCCEGSCTHVWNYAQALSHLFPDLERSLRQTEFDENQNEEGHQQFRSSLPIRKAVGKFHPASDGQLGGIMKMYREWKICGDISWLSSYWDKMKLSIDYCINIWDKKEEGVLKEPHHNTYDIEFWGADPMCTTFYLGGLKAISLIGKELNKDVKRYENLYKKGKEYLETKLFNGEYFFQSSDISDLDAKLDTSKENEKCVLLLEKEGPKYQYGTGCISDGMVGAWLAKMCYIDDILDTDKIKSHLLSVYKYNYKRSLVEHSNPQRPGFACGDEAGLILCTWPKGGKPSLPFVYSDEVWTGIEYQVASHLISYGYTIEGMDIINACRSRYNGTRRNPFNEYECGHWYARALASYGLIQSFSGVTYDETNKTLYISNTHDNGFTSFFTTAHGYGTIFIKKGHVKIDVVYGDIDVDNINIVLV